jgi:hypothetical protein
VGADTEVVGLKLTHIHNISQLDKTAYLKLWESFSVHVVGADTEVVRLQLTHIHNISQLDKNVRTKVVD